MAQLGLSPTLAAGSRPVPRLPTIFVLLGYKSGVPDLPPFLGFHSLLEQLIELRKTLTSCLPANYIVRDLIKGID